MTVNRAHNKTFAAITKKRLLSAVLRGIFRLMLRAMRVIPWKPAIAIGNTAGLLAYFLSKRYRKVANKNLKIAFGETMTQHQRNLLIRKVFVNFARSTLIEFLKVPSLNSDAIRKLAPMTSLEPIHTARRAGKGVIVVSAHLGNWELLARRIAMEGIPVKVVTRQSEDPEFNEITDTLRESGGYMVHPRGSSPRGLLRHLRDNGVIAILADQKSDDVFVPFFGKLAGTTAGPAVLSLKTGAAILPLFAPRMTDGTIAACFLELIDTTPSGDSDADTKRIMAEITVRIEEMVCKYPDQWLWLHDRWRIYGEPPAEVLESWGGITAARD